MAGNIKTIIENAVKNAEITDFIMLVRNGCIRVISVEDFIKDITLGGQAVCDTLLNCWKTMGQFDGGTNPENGDNEDCDCSDDFIKIHFPKGEGIKLITSAEYVNVPDSIYIRPIGADKYQMTVVDEEGNERSPVMPEIPTIDYPVIDGISLGDGLPIYQGLVNKKIQTATIGSRTLIVSEVIDSETSLPTGEIQINLPGGGSSSNDYYLDTNFIRPSNWGTSTNPKEEILNTTINPIAKKVPTGRLNDPFIDYTEFLLYAVGNSADSNQHGFYTRSNPRHGGVLRIPYTASTEQKIEVNEWDLMSQNGAFLVHTGLEEYSVDMRRLWVPEIIDNSTGKLKRPILFSLGGEGGFTRKNGLGLIYSKGDETKTTSQINYRFQFRTEGLGYTLFEEKNPFPNTNPNIRLTRANGTTLLSNGNTEVWGRVQLPTTPLVVIDGSTFQFWGAQVSGPRLFIIAYTQSHIKWVNNGTMTSSAEQVMYQVGNDVVGYERKMIQDAPGNTTDENDFLINRKDNITYPGEKGFYYKAFADYVVFDIQHGTWRVENLATEPNGFQYAGASATVRITANGSFDNLISWRDTGGGASYNLIKSIGTPKGIVISNLDLVSRLDTMVEGDGISPVVIVMSNTKINVVRKISKNVPNLTIYTNGTLCSIQYKPIISIEAQPNNTTALASGYIVGMLYRNSTTGEITQVI